ncbi:MAG: tubulin beta chain [Verrucomicrobiae bacterium]|nr:tubulin beta chain [Verrucomicrobiae bacterium]MCP5550990.1 tubulin beta chain [Akkermansiaceae bacterium]
MKVNNNIVVCVGQAGVQIGGALWRDFCLEHGIDPTSGQVPAGGTPKGDWISFFSRFGDDAEKNYVPRTVFVDLEPSVINEVKKNSGTLFNPACFISSDEGAGGNFAVGNRGRGGEMLPTVMDRIEGEISKCDNVGGIMILHSLGGGSGSGLGCLVIETLKKKYPEIPLMSCAVIPSPQVSSVVTEPYNTVFALSVLKKYCDACLIFDNEALFNIAVENWGIESPDVKELNSLITEVLTGVTASMRFSGFLTVEISVREYVTNLVPKPGLHFMITSASPLTPPDQSKFEELTVTQMIDQLFDADNVFAECSPMDGRFLSTAVQYRGVMDDKPQADAALAALRTKLPLTSWIPTAFKIGYVDEPGVHHRKSIVLMANNTEIARVFERICNNFDKLWERKAFANWYFSEGMTEEEISEMRATTGDLIDIYKAAEASGGGSGGGGKKAAKPVSKAADSAPAKKAPATVVEESEEIEPEAPAADAGGKEDRPVRLRDLVNQGKNS